jgi:hypothetical protein
MNAPHTSHNGVADSTDDDAAASACAEQSDRARTGGPDDVWAEIVDRWRELREYAGYYIAANIDRLRLTGRTALMWSILGLVVGLIAVSIVAAASVLLIVGLATGLGELMGGRIWLGQLVVSATILLAASGGAWFVLRRSLRNYQRTIVQKYELRKEEERTEYGTNVEQRAKERSQNS